MFPGILAFDGLWLWFLGEWTWDISWDCRSRLPSVRVCLPGPCLDYWFFSHWRSWSGCPRRVLACGIVSCWFFARIGACGSAFDGSDKPLTQYLCLDEKRKLGLVSRIKKQIAKFEITNAELGIVTIWFTIPMFDVSEKFMSQN